MTRLHEGLDYLLYRVYIWGGIAALVIYLDALEFIDVPRTGTKGVAIYSAPVTPWVLGILAYWWWVFLFKGNKELKESVRCLLSKRTGCRVTLHVGWSRR